MLPLGATCTRMTSPQRPPFMVLGRVGQPSTSWYGLGSDAGLTGAACCARATPPHAATITALAISMSFDRTAHDILGLLGMLEFRFNRNSHFLHVTVSHRPPGGNYAAPSTRLQQPTKLANILELLERKDAVDELCAFLGAEHGRYQVTSFGDDFIVA